MFGERPEFVPKPVTIEQKHYDKDFVSAKRI